MRLPMVLAIIVAGIVCGMFNGWLQACCGKAACRAQRQAVTITLILLSYFIRYAIIIAVTLGLVRYFGLPPALLFLGGMMFATLGMAVFWRGGTTTPKTAAQQAPLDKPD